MGLVIDPLMEIWQTQKMLGISLCDGLDNSPGDDAARKIVDDR